MLVDFTKELFSTNKDIVMLKENNAVVESIKNFIENNILDVPMTTNNSIGVRNMLLKVKSTIEIRSIIFEIKEILESSIPQIENVEISYSDNGSSRSIDLELTLRNTINNDLPYNLVIRI